MPLESVKHTRQFTAQLAPRVVSDRFDNFLLVRLRDGKEMWCTPRDLAYLKAQYEVIGHARRV